MKKFIAFTALIIIAISCSHKTTPTTSVAVAKPDSPEAIAGKIVFTAKCGTCHELKNPGDYTALQWTPIVKDMSRKAKLNDTDKANVLAYVQSNAKK